MTYIVFSNFPMGACLTNSRFWTPLFFVYNKILFIILLVYSSSFIYIGNNNKKIIHILFILIIFFFFKKYTNNIVFIVDRITVIALSVFVAMNIDIFKHSLL